jgi:hypothetical protein
MSAAAPIEKYDPAAYTLRMSSIADEYYCGDLQGTLQLRKDPHELAKLDVEYLSDTTKNWTIVNTSDELFMRLLRKNKKVENHELICTTQSVGADGSVWLKGAILNKDTGLIYLLTSTNNHSAVDRKLDSHDPTYVIGHYRMCAPKIFWVHLKNTLRTRGYPST